MIKKYIFNFWIWWYGVQFVTIIHHVFSLWSLSLAQLNIVPMMTNLFVPMFQDQSGIGKFMSFLLRIGWVIVGSVFQLLLTVPLLAIILAWILAPFVCLVQMGRYLM